MTTDRCVSAGLARGGLDRGRDRPHRSLRGNRSMDMRLALSSLAILGLLAANAAMACEYSKAKTATAPMTPAPTASSSPVPSKTGG